MGGSFLPHAASLRGAAALPLVLACLLSPGCGSSLPGKGVRPGSSEGAAPAGGFSRVPLPTESLRHRIEPRRDSTSYSNLTPAGIDRDRVLLEVLDLLGVPYAFGGRTPGGLDCSGFAALVYERALDRPLPRSAREQFGSGRDVARGELQFADLVFFGSPGSPPSHVGIYIEDDLFAHASASEGVVISSLERPWYRDRFLGARRLER
ncbi:MAG: C40 family peptidase [Bacteroidota bacterium]